jgi:adenylate kinase
MRVLLVAPPGAGKSTHGRLLGREFGIPFISSGQLLRAEIDAGTALGAEVAGLVTTGHLVPDELIAELVRRRLTDPERLDQFILDGFPRTLTQAEIADHWPDGVRLDFNVVLQFVAPDSELARRIDERATESERTDDTKEIWRQRLIEYENSVQPLLDLYRGRGILLQIDVTGTVDAVQERILLALSARGLGAHGSSPA